MQKPLLLPGDQIGIIAPSGSFKKNRLTLAIKYFEKLGFKVKLGNFIYKSDRYLAGSPQERAKDLHHMFRLKSIKAIFTARGGYGSTQILPLLNYSLIQNNPKPLFGFSDTTALQLALWEKSNLPSISGLSLCSDFSSNGFIEYTKKKIEKILFESAFENIQLKSKSPNIEIQGKLIGGCLTLISALCGTEFQPTLKNRLLFIEDVKEEPYHIDRMLTQLSQQKDFHQLKGIIFGNFYECLAENINHGTIATVLNKFEKTISIPVFFNLPYGHQPERCLLPIGLTVNINKKSVLKISNFKYNH